MGFDIPGIASDPDKIITLTAPVIKGEADFQGTLIIPASGLKVGSTPVTSLAADLNLLSSFVSGYLVPVKCLYRTIIATTGTAVVTSLGVIPAGAVILCVSAFCSVAFNGAVTKTFEVGINGNTDKYIDPSDCPVTLAGVMDTFIGTNNDQKTLETLTAALTLQSVHTNTTHAGAVLGTMVVRVIYI
jgi:hypothetical protein